MMFYITIIFKFKLRRFSGALSLTYSAVVAAMLSSLYSITHALPVLARRRLFAVIGLTAESMYIYFQERPLSPEAFTRP